jgi:hypothetical protein
MKKVESNVFSFEIMNTIAKSMVSDRDDIDDAIEFLKKELEQMEQNIILTKKHMLNDELDEIQSNIEKYYQNKKLLETLQMQKKH